MHAFYHPTSQPPNQLGHHPLSNGKRSDHFGPGMSEPDSAWTWKLGIPEGSLEEALAPR